MIDRRQTTKVAIIMAVLVLVTAFVLYTLITRPNAESLAAEAALAQARAAEYQGESTLLQAKAQLVEAYPDTLHAAGSASWELGRGLFLTSLAIGVVVIAFAIAVGYIMRSTSNAYMEINAIKVLPKLPESAYAGALGAGTTGGDGDVLDDGGGGSYSPYRINLDGDTDYGGYAERAQQQYEKRNRGITKKLRNLFKLS